MGFLLDERHKHRVFKRLRTRVPRFFRGSPLHRHSLQKTAETFRNNIDRIAEHDAPVFDYAIIDTGPNLSDKMGAALVASDCENLLATGFLFTWGTAGSVATATPMGAIPALPAPQSQAEATGTKAGKKVKFTCPQCNARAWGKGSLNLICGDCGVKMTAAADTDQQAAATAIIAQNLLTTILSMESAQKRKMPRKPPGQI